MPRALVAGITGQDGHRLAEFGHGRGPEVFGMVKGPNDPRVEALHEEMPFIELVSGDLADLPPIVSALEASQPDDVCKLGAISFAAFGWKPVADLPAVVKVMDAHDLQHEATKAGVAYERLKDRALTLLLLVAHQSDRSLTEPRALGSIEEQC